MNQMDWTYTTIYTYKHIELFRPTSIPNVIYTFTTLPNIDSPDE